MITKKILKISKFSFFGEHVKILDNILKIPKIERNKNLL